MLIFSQFHVEEIGALSCPREGVRLSLKHLPHLYCISTDYLVTEQREAESQREFSENFWLILSLLWKSHGYLVYVMFLGMSSFTELLA